MRNCEDANRWPDSLSKVPDADLDNYLAHAEDCPYHGDLLRREEENMCRKEEKLATAFRLARGLSDDGKLTTTPAARAELDQLYRRYQTWAACRDAAHGPSAATAAASEKVSLALRYRGEVVARADYFYGMRASITREFDQPGDLQLWNLPDGATGEPVFLGVYPISGYSHGGEPAIIPLPNGKKAVLRVTHLGECSYAVKLDCAADGQLDQLRLNTAVAADDESDELSLGLDALGEGGGAFGPSDVPVHLLQTPSPMRLGRYVVTFMIVGFLTFMALSVLAKNPEPSQATTKTVEVQPADDPNTLPTTTNPPVTQADLIQGGSQSQPSPEASMSQGVKVSFTSPPGRTASEPKARRGGSRTGDGRPKAADTTNVAEPGADSSRSRALTLDWFHLPAGSNSQAMLVRAGDDPALREAFIAAMGRAFGLAVLSASADGKQTYSVVQLQFDWKDEVGTVNAKISDEAGVEVAELTYRRKASSLEEAREQAVHRVVAALKDYLRAPSASGAPASDGAPAAPAPAGGDSTRLHVEEGDRTQSDF